jgi:hypothetical protein
MYAVDMYGVPGTHTPASNGQHHHHVAGASMWQVWRGRVLHHSYNAVEFQPLASFCIVLLRPIRVGYVTMHFNVQECGGGWTGEG